MRRWYYLIILISLYCYSCSSNAPKAINQSVDVVTQHSQPSPTSLPPSTPTATFDPCPQSEAELFREEVLEILDKFIEAGKFLSIDVQSARELARVQMAEIREEANGISFPLCGEEVHASLLSYMDASLKWADVIITNKDSPEYDTSLAIMIEELKLFGEALWEFDNEASITIE